MVEYLDILDESGKPTGEKETYDEVHKKGLLHRTVHVWLMNAKRELLIQKRADTRLVCPNYWDISVASHISAGQSSLEAARRETSEELGLTFPQSVFNYLFTIRHSKVLNDGTYFNEELQDVYLVYFDGDIGEVKMQEEEVSDVRWIKIEDLKTMISEGKEKIVDHDEEYQKLFDHIATLKI